MSNNSLPNRQQPMRPATGAERQARYTTHKTKAAAIAASVANKDYSHQIIDTDGAVYVIKPDYYGSTLVKA